MDIKTILFILIIPLQNDTRRIQANRKIPFDFSGGTIEIKDSVLYFMALPLKIRPRGRCF